MEQVLTNIKALLALHLLCDVRCVSEALDEEVDEIVMGNGGPWWGLEKRGGRGKENSYDGWASSGASPCPTPV
jgi:hypothetical protein